MISFYLISMISFIAYLNQSNNEERNCDDKKVIVVGKDKIPNKYANQVYVFACHPLNSEKFKDFDFHPSFCLYNKVKVGDTIITDIPLNACRNQSICSVIYLLVSIISVLLGLISNACVLICCFAEE